MDLNFLIRLVGSDLKSINQVCSICFAAKCPAILRKNEFVLLDVVHQECPFSTILVNYLMASDRKLFATKSNQRGEECGMSLGEQV